MGLNVYYTIPMFMCTGKTHKILNTFLHSSPLVMTNYTASLISTSLTAAFFRESCCTLLFFIVWTAFVVVSVPFFSPSVIVYKMLLNMFLCYGNNK